MPKHELLVLKDAAFTEACSWWDSGRERSSPSVTSAGSSKVNKLFHMTEQLDCSFSWINEVTTVQSLWPNTLWGITLPVCLIWLPDVFLFTLTILWGFWRTLGIWQVHICQFISACSDHSSSCSSAPFEMQSWQKRLSWTCVQSHTLLWTCSWSASTSNPGYMMFYGHLQAAPIPNLQNSSHSVSLSYMLLLQIIPGSRNRKKCSEIHNK